MEESEFDIQSAAQLDSIIMENKGILVYFSTPDCNVCKVLKPKVKELLQVVFPLMKFAYVDISSVKDAAAQRSIFTVPTVIIYFEGKEFQRKSRNFGLDELKDDIYRPYSILF